MCRYPIYCSRIKLAITIGTAVATLFASEIDIFLHHLVDLKAQLLVNFSSDDLSVYEKGHQKANSHHKQDNQNCKPQSSGFVIVLLVVVFLDEADTFSWGIDERIAYSFKHFWSFEQAIEVTIINGDFRIKVDAHFSRFLV